ncbi:MAG: tetratricopeptide repeat protein [bacterium]
MKKAIVVIFLVFITLINNYAPPSLAGTLKEAEVYKDRGNNYAESGKFNKAVEEYERALAIYSEYADVLYNLGVTYDSDLNDNAKAIYYYTKFLEVEPYSTDARMVKKYLEKAKRDIAKEKGEELKDNKVTISLTEPVVKETSSKVKGLIIRNYDVSATYNKHIDIMMPWSVREGYTGEIYRVSKYRGSKEIKKYREKRKYLIEERKRATDLIDYEKEATRLVLEEAGKKAIGDLGINLRMYPSTIDISRHVREYKVTKKKEDTREIEVVCTATIDLKTLKDDLTNLNFIFEPRKININIQGEVPDYLIERFKECLRQKSIYTGEEITVFTESENFARELKGLKVGDYNIEVANVGSNEIILSVWK